MANTIANKNDVANATGKELLAFYNEHTGGNKLVKFQNRVQAEARVCALIAEMEAEQAGDQKAAAEACKRGADVTFAEKVAQEKVIAKKLASVTRAHALGKKLALTDGKDRMAVVDDFNKVTEAEHAAHRADTVKPYQTAKTIVADCIARGVTARKDIIAAGIAAGIKYNTIDGAHYSMCVRK